MSQETKKEYKVGDWVQVSALGQIESIETVPEAGNSLQAKVKLTYPVVTTALEFLAPADDF